MSERSPQDQDKYVVRFPNGMRDRIREAAESNGRSMNAEIIQRLEHTFAPPDAELPESEIGELARQFAAYRREQRELYEALRAAGVIQGTKPTAKEWLALQARDHPTSED